MWKNKIHRANKAATLAVGGHSKALRGMNHMQQRRVWAADELHVLECIAHDRELWPLLQCSGVSGAEIYDEADVRERRCAVCEAFPARTWASIVARLSRSGLDNHFLARLLGPKMHDKHVGVHTKRHMKPWDRWDSKQSQNLQDALNMLPDVPRNVSISKAELLRRQEVLLNTVSPRRTWMALYLKITRKRPHGMADRAKLKKKLGTACRSYAGEMLAGVFAPQPGDDYAGLTGCEMHDDKVGDLGDEDRRGDLGDDDRRGDDFPIENNDGENFMADNMHACESIFSDDANGLLSPQILYVDDPFKEDDFRAETEAFTRVVGVR